MKKIYKVFKYWLLLVFFLNLFWTFKNMFDHFNCYVVCTFFFFFLLTDEGLHHSHAVGGEGASFVRADGRGIAHGLTRIQVAYKIVVLHHFLYIW